MKCFQKNKTSEFIQLKKKKLNDTRTYNEKEERLFYRTIGFCRLPLAGRDEKFCCS